MFKVSRIMYRLGVCVGFLMSWTNHTASIRRLINIVKSSNVIRQNEDLRPVLIEIEQTLDKAVLSGNDAYKMLAEKMAELDQIDRFFDELDRRKMQ